MIDKVRDLEQHFGYLPDRYLQSLRGQVVSDRDLSLMMSGDSIVDSIRSHRLSVCDPVSPTPGSSRDGDSVVPFLRSLFGLPVVSSSSESVSSAVLPSVSGATFMRGDSSVVTGWVAPSVTCTFSDPVASGSLLGRPSVASSFASAVPSGVASVVPPSVASGSGGFVLPLPAYPATSFTLTVSAPLSFSMASLLAPPPPPSMLPSAPFSSSAPLVSSQPVGPYGSVSLGSGGGGAWFQGRWGWRLLMRRMGVACLNWIKRGCIPIR